MKKLSRMIACALVLLTALSVPSYGWDDQGHMMVAAVAWEKLTPAMKKRVIELINLNPDRDNFFSLIPPTAKQPTINKMLFMIAATWPDRIKSNPDYTTDGPHNGNLPPHTPEASQNIGYDDTFRHKYWHFIDISFPTHIDTPTPNAQERLETFIPFLASPKSAATDDKKSYDLCWILHLVGDVHQPLHCVTRVSATSPNGDDGGNGVKISTPHTNLHAFWDDLLGTSKKPADAITAANALASAPASKANDLTVSDWIEESRNLAQQDAYKNPPIGDGSGPFATTPAYQTKARSIARQRVALAGARLAKVINDNLK